VSSQLPQPAPALTSRLELGQNGQLQKVKFFSDAQLQSSISSALAKVEESSAILHLEKNPTGFNAVVAAKLNGHWSVAVAYNRSDWGDAVASQVKFSWR